MAKTKQKQWTSDEDRKKSKNSTRDTGTFIKIDMGRTPIYLMSSNYVDGFAHYVTLPNGDIHRVACAGEESGNGYAPDVCPICAINKERWAEARDLSANGRPQRGEALKKATNRQRGTYELYIVACEGEMTVGKIVNGKKKMKVDFEDGHIGKLKLTERQRNDLWSLAESGTLPYIDSNKDLLNRYIIFDKKKRGDDEWATIEYAPAKKPTEKPKIKITAEQKAELNLDSEFEVDMPELKKLAKILMGGAVADEEVDYEDDVDVDDYVDDDESDVEVDDDDTDYDDLDDDDNGDFDDDDDFLDDESDDDDDESDDPEPALSEDFLDDIDDFEDDLPWEEDEPIKPKPSKKKAPAKAPKKTTGTKKKPAENPASTSRKSTSKKGTGAKKKKLPKKADL